MVRVSTECYWVVLHNIYTLFTLCVKDPEGLQQHTLSCFMDRVSCYFSYKHGNSDDSKQQYFSSNTNDDEKSSSVKLDWICCRMILEGFPLVNKRSARTKNNTVKKEGGIQEAKRNKR